MVLYQVKIFVHIQTVQWSEVFPVHTMPFKTEVLKMKQKVTGKIFSDKKCIHSLNYCPKENIVLCYMYDKTAQDKRLYID